MPTTVSCGRGIASSLTQVIAERRSEKYPKSGDTKYLSSSMDIFFWLVIMANGNIIFLFVKTSVLLGDNGWPACWLLVQKDSWQERTDRGKQGVAFYLYFTLYTLYVTLVEISTVSPLVTIPAFDLYHYYQLQKVSQGHLTIQTYLRP